MALSLISFETGANTCIVSATGADVATLDALPLPDHPNGQIGDVKGLWALAEGAGKYVVPMAAARALGLNPGPFPYS